jgi:hypothetical protein
MRVRRIILTLIISCSTLTGFTQLYFPNEQFYNNEIDRFYMRDSSNQSSFNAHLSMRPIMDKRTNRDSIYYKDLKVYFWFTQKLLKENFIIFKGEDFWCSVDPILDLEGGTDLSADSLGFLYWNTRGLRVQARFFNKIAFTTSVYENQAFVPTYLSNYIDKHGELFPGGNNYNQANAVMPGFARTKPFKITGYDFAFAEGQVSYVPNEHFNIHFGNGSHFIGYGHRSLLLSDFAGNYPFAKFEGNLLKGKLQYNAIYAIQQNLYRLPEFTSVESTFERKLGTYHYLDYAITPKITIGLFEGAQWKRTDSLGTQQPNWLFLNPVPFVNAGIMAKETIGYNHILGMNFSWVFFKNRFYGQALLDNGALGGFQVGFKSMDLLTPKLDVQIEANIVADESYLANEKRYNYSHNNLSIAHPLTSGFYEYILQINYEVKNIFFSNRTLYQSKTIVDSNYNVVNIVFDDVNSVSQVSIGNRNTLINHFEAGYRFNKAYNLQAMVGWMFRNGHGEGPDNHTNYVYFGLRTRLRNKTLDF